MSPVGALIVAPVGSEIGVPVGVAAAEGVGLGVAVAVAVGGAVGGRLGLPPEGLGEDAAGPQAASSRARASAPIVFMY